MTIGNFERTENNEKNIEQENPEKVEVNESNEERSFADKLKDGIHNLFHKNEAKETTEDTEGIEDKLDENGDKPDVSEDTNETEKDPDSNESRKDIRDQKLDEYSSKLWDTVKMHGEMLDRRTDLSPDDKIEMQAEITDNYKKAVAEYKDWLENESEYKDSPEE